MHGLFLSLLVTGAFLTLLPAVRAAARRLRLGAEMQRKAVHVGTGFASLSFPWLFPSPLWFFICMGMMLALLLAMRAASPLRRFARALHGVERRSLGDVGFLLAVILLYLLAREQWLLYVLPLLVLTISDALAALVGERRGRHRYAAPGGEKSWEGTAACAASAFALALPFLWLAGLPFALALPVALALALAAAIVEGLAWNGLDNLLLPLALHLLLAGPLDPQSLSATAALSVLLFTAALAAVLAAVTIRARSRSRLPCIVEASP